MIVGDPSVFAIESCIIEAFERLSFRALGFFVIHVGGRSFGRRERDSTMLARSFDDVNNRVAERGRHSAPFASEADAGAIAVAVRDALFADKQQESYFGIPLLEFSRVFYKTWSDCMWAPDGDEAFDDGSYVLHFDVDGRVRLIAFKRMDGCRPNPETLREVWLPADAFYEILQQWRDAFDTEWSIAMKDKAFGIPGE